MFILFVLLSAPVKAGIVEDTGSGMVTNGIDGFFGYSANELAGGKNATNFSVFASWYNPLKNPVVVSTIKNTSVFAFTIFISYILLAMSYLVLQTRKPKAAQAVEYILNKGKSYDIETFVKTCGTIIALFCFVLVIMMAILYLVQAASDMMNSSAMTVIRTSSHSGLMNFIYNCFWFIILISFGVRNLILTYIFAFSVVLVTSWGFSFLQKPVEIIGLYFLVIAFMQPIMVGMAAIGIETIDYQNNLEGLGAVTSLISLFILLIVVSLVCIVGPIYGHKIFFKLRG
jgi:hypothetical protein